MDQLSSGSHGFRLVLNDIGGAGQATAIKNEDLPILRTAATLVAGFCSSVSVVAWAPAAIAALVLLLYDFRKKKIPLSAVQAAILREIKVHPNLTIKEIVAGLQIKGLDEKQVAGELKALSEIARADGVTVCLVSENAEDRWRTEDI
jgi:hypothetical protein